MRADCNEKPRKIEAAKMASLWQMISKKNRATRETDQTPEAPFRDPPQQPPVAISARLDLPPATVRHARRRFEGKQTPLGTGRRNATSPALQDQCLIIGRCVEAKNAQPKPVLPFHLAVTAAGIAAGFGQDRDHFVAKRNWPWPREPIHFKPGL